jgi:hypothetical protein
MRRSQRANPIIVDSETVQPGTSPGSFRVDVELKTLVHGLVAK